MLGDLLFLLLKVLLFLLGIIVLYGGIFWIFWRMQLMLIQSKPGQEKATRIIEWLNKLWLPEKKHTTSDKLIFCRLPSEKGTSLWDYTEFSVKGAIAGLIIASFGTFMVASVSAIYKTDTSPNYLWAAFAGIAGSIISQLSVSYIAYILAEWERRATRLILFANVMFLIRARPAWEALIPFVKAKEPTYQRTPVSDVKDSTVVTDPEKLKGWLGKKTSKIRDSWSRILADKGILSIQIPSSRWGSQSIDVFGWLPDANSVLEMIEDAKSDARKTNKLMDKLESQRTDITAGDPAKPMSKAEKNEQLGRIEQSQKRLGLVKGPEVTYDLFLIPEQ